MNDLIPTLWKVIKKNWYIPAIIVAGIALMLYSGKENEASESVAINMEQEYINQTEQKLAEILNAIPGAGKCRVAITLSSGSGKEYVREEGKVLVITDKEGNQAPVLEREYMPQIAGVAIFSEGATNIRVQNSIIRSVSSVLGIGTNRVYVLEYKED